jgi:hypothetical protein
VVIFITLLAGFVPLLQVTFFALLEDLYPGRLAVKDRDKTHRITGVILDMGTKEEVKANFNASSMFSAIFVFQKSYTGNILGIGRNKSQTSRNSPKLLENRRGNRVGPRETHTTGRRGPGLGPFAYKDPPMRKT